MKSAGGIATGVAGVRGGGATARRRIVAPTIEFPSARIQWQMAQCSPSRASVGVVNTGVPDRTGTSHPASGSTIQAWRGAAKGSAKLATKAASATSAEKCRRDRRMTDVNLSP